MRLIGIRFATAIIFSILMVASIGASSFGWGGSMFFNWTLSLDDATWDYANDYAIVSGTITNSQASTFDLYMNDLVSVARDWAPDGLQFSGISLAASEIRLSPGASWTGELLRLSADGLPAAGYYPLEAGLAACAGEVYYPGMMLYAQFNLIASELPDPGAIVVPEHNAGILASGGLAAITMMRRKLIRIRKSK